MPKEKIFIVEDEEDILELVRYNLAKEGYEVDGVMSGEEALKVIKQKMPDLIILDLMLPGVDGLQVCKTIKSTVETKHIPVVMLTAKGEESDIVMGLELGADDYVTKPFSPKVLMARIKTVLRRKSSEEIDEESTVKIDELIIYPGKREVLVEGEPVILTYTEFQVLHLLARRPGWVFTRYQIVGTVHGEEYDVTDRSVDVLIVGLRKKLGSYGSYIETVRGVGYKFKD
ncbi:MAG: response regulator transcription factor [bacterium]